MSVDAFDSNILIYAIDDRDLRKRDIARQLVTAAVANGSASISYQVVQETLNVLTTKFSARANPVDARDLLERVLSPLWSVMPSAMLYERALQIRARYGLHFYDALVVAGAIQAGCTRLLSEDLQHGQVIDGLTIENPFLA